MKEEAFTLQEFISIVSHDLRAPIRHITQFSSILVNSLDELTEEQQQCADYIQLGAEKCNLMIEGLTQLSRVQSWDIEPKPVDIEFLCRDVIEELTSRYDCQPTVSIRSDTELLGLDPRHVDVLVRMLLDNAFKFRSADTDFKLNVTFSCVDGQQTLSVEDNGIGMVDSFLPHCTQIFKQYDNQREGVGIGLSVAEQVVSRYEGNITIVSSVDKGNNGSTISVGFPMKS